MNKPFKYYYKAKWTDWMVSGERIHPAGIMCAAAPDLLSQWVCTSWNEINDEMIISSFTKCGISNALNGMEDDMLYADELVNGGENNAKSNDAPDPYDGRLTATEMNELFAKSEDESDVDIESDRKIMNLL